MGKTGNQRYTYARPDPFVSPAIEERRSGSLGGVGGFSSSIPSDFFQHDQLVYSGPIIENIMFHISLEYEFRGQGRQQWKAYKTGPADFDLFFAGGSRNRNAPFVGATTLQNYPVKFFPLYIKDMQEKIETLVEDENFPDSIASLMSRVFLSNVSNGGVWTSQNSLPNTLKVPVSKDGYSDTTHIETLTPLENIKTTWAFPADGSHVEGVVPRMGIDFKGQAYVTRGKLGVTTSDVPGKSNFQGNAKLKWPRSVIGQRRTQEGFRIIDGFVEEKVGASIDGIDSIHMPGIEADEFESGRAKHFRQVATEDALLPTAAGKPDLQSGYSWFAHHPHVLQQCRYQPPIIERWEGKLKLEIMLKMYFLI